jgi:hypothetical protein
MKKENALVPLRNHGILCMLIGFLIPPSESLNLVVAWRGIMVIKAAQQLLLSYCEHIAFEKVRRKQIESKKGEM